MDGYGTTVDPCLALSAHSAGDVTVAELTGELDIGSAPALREQLRGLLRPGFSRLVLDLSKVTFCDASGLAVLLSTGRHAGQLGGFLRLAAVSPQVGQALNITGLRQHLATFPTVAAAIARGQSAQRRKARAAGSSGAAGGGAAGGGAAGSHPRPASKHPGPPLPARADSGELRGAVTALLACSDAWHEADPSRRFSPALRAMAHARDGVDDIALDTAARSMLSALVRHPLASFPAVAVTATRLRRVFYPAPRLVTT
jgi:anti-sigma B factor antagonist